jgi:signal transduction histidine kinase
MKLSVKVGSTLLLVLTVALAISGWISVRKEREVLNDLLQKHGQSLSNTMAVVCIEPLLSEDYPLLDTFLETTGRERDDILSIEVMQSGKLVSTYDAGGKDLVDRVIFNSDVLFTMETGQPPIKLGEIHLGLSDRQNKQVIASRMRDLITETVIIFVLLSGTLMLVLREMILKKINQLSDHAKRVGAGNFDHKIDLGTKDELGHLANTLTDMVGTIKASQKELKQYQEHLELLVKERTRELEEAQEELVNKAMEAGRAQLAAMVLHNVGNAMTPMNVQIEGLKADHPKRIVQYLEKCYQDLDGHSGDLHHYVNEDQRGKQVFAYMGELIHALYDRHKNQADILNNMEGVVAHISEILSLQRTYASGIQETKESADLNSLMDDAIRIQMGALKERRITVKRQYSDNLPKLLIDKNRLLQVLVNLIKNSYEAIDAVENHAEKVIRLYSFSEKGCIGFEITDSGIGIEADQVDTITGFGKSKKGSSGFGLSYCKMFVEANNGTLSISSPGKGKGATVRAGFEI